MPIGSLIDAELGPYRLVDVVLREQGRMDKPVALTVSEVTRTWTFVMTPSP